MKLHGWIIVWLLEHSDVLTMTSNIANEALAQKMADLMRDEGKTIVGVCSAETLVDLLRSVK